MRLTLPFWALSVCCLMVLSACSEDDETDAGADVGVDADHDTAQDPEPDAAPPPAPEDPAERCEAACHAIYEGCGDMFVYDDADGGGAMVEATCVERCLEEDKFRGGEWCVATEAECESPPEKMIDACLPDDYHPPACSHLGAWSRTYVELEEQAVALINEHRTQGAQCGDVEFQPTQEVVMDERLRCAARLHSADMVERGFFGTTDPDGVGTAERIADAGFEATRSDGIVTSGQQSAEQLVGAWIADVEHCETIMGPDFDFIGIGRYELEQWTLKIAEKDS